MFEQPYHVLNLFEMKDGNVTYVKYVIDSLNV